MPRLVSSLRILLPFAFAIAGLAACNLVTPTPLQPPVPTPSIPQAQILFPAHNQQVVQGVIFDIEILASDPAGGLQRVELYVDEQLQQTSESDAEDLRDYRVTMNWFAKETGWHKFAVFAYRADGAASHPHIIALEVIPTS